MPTPNDLLTAAAVFGALLLIHIVWWRFHPPRREMLNLFLLFLGLPSLTLLFIFIVKVSGPVAIPQAILAFFYQFLLVWGISLFYLMTYPAFQTGCPSLQIVLAAWRAGERGLDAAEIEQLFPRESLFSDRFQELVQDGLVRQGADGWEVTPSGMRTARFFQIYRKLLGLPPGDG